MPRANDKSAYPRTWWLTPPEHSTNRTFCRHAVLRGGHNHRTPPFIASAVPGCSQVGLADGASAPSTAKSSCNTLQLGPMPLFGRQKADGGKPRVDLHINIPEDAQLDDGTS